MSKLNNGYIGSDQRFTQSGLTVNKKHFIERKSGNRKAFSSINSISQLDLWINEKSWQGGSDGSDSISAIIDQSNRKNNLSRNYTSQGRIYKTNAKNGLPALEFNGSNNQYYTCSLDSLLLNDNNYSFDVTVIFVGRNDSQSGFFNFGNNLNTPFCNLRFGRTEWEAAGVRGEIWDASDFSYGDWTIHTWKRDSSSAINIKDKDLVPNYGSTGVGHRFMERVSSQSIYVNGQKLIRIGGSQIGLASNKQYSFGGVSSRHIIGRGRNSPFNGIFGELIVFYKALNDRELSFVHESLSEKWAIPLV